MLYYQDLPAKKVKNIINLVRSQKTRYKKSKNDVLEGNLVFYGMMILFFSMFLFGAVLAVSHIGGFSIIEIKDTLINIGYFLLFGVFLIFYSFIHGYFSKNSLRSNLEKFTYSGELSTIFDDKDYNRYRLYGSK